MDTRISDTSRSASRPAGLAAAALFFVAIGCAPLDGARQRPQAPLHRYYEPAESPEILAFVASCVSEAERLYGRAVHPVREVHVRQSQRRRHLHRLARADVCDWPQLCRLLATRGGPVFTRVRGTLGPDGLRVVRRASAAARAPAHADQLAVVAGLNRAIASGERLPDLRQPAEAHSQPRNREAANRSALQAALPGCLLPAPEPALVAERFSLCERMEERPGTFVLYVNAAPGEEKFWLLLAHESAHTLNPRLYDWYVEGLNNVFARHMARKTGRSWTPFERRFARGARADAYAISYRMMEAVCGAVPKDAIRRFLACAAPHPDWPARRQCIDIDRWLRSLRPGERGRARAAIAAHAEHLARQRGDVYAFPRPRAIRQQE